MKNKAKNERSPVRNEKNLSAAGGTPRAALVKLPDPKDRRSLISLAAYQRAQQRGFAPGGEVQDWLTAEMEVNQLLGHPAGAENPPLR